MKFLKNGNYCMPPINGGYLIMTLDGEEFHIISAPSMILNTDRHRDIVVENFDHFKDEQGNIFDISVYSSNVGVDWELQVNTEDSSLKNRIDLEYHANDY